MNFLFFLINSGKEMPVFYLVGYPCCSSCSTFFFVSFMYRRIYLKGNANEDKKKKKEGETQIFQLLIHCLNSQEPGADVGLPCGCRDAGTWAPSCLEHALWRPWLQQASSSPTPLALWSSLENSGWNGGKHTAQALA